MCRLAPTMATLILAPWEFWLSCKNWVREGGKHRSLPFPEGCVWRWRGKVSHSRLQGSDPLNPRPNSISPASLVHHYQTLSPKLSRIVILCQHWERKEMDTNISWPYFTSSLDPCASQSDPDCFATTRPCLYVVFRESARLYLGKPMLHWSFDAMKATTGRTDLPVWQHSNLLSWYKLPHFSIYQFSCYFVGRGQTELLLCGASFEVATDNCETLAPRGGNAKERKALNNGPSLEKASKSQWLTSKEPLVSAAVLWLGLNMLFPWL